VACGNKNKKPLTRPATPPPAKCIKRLTLSSIYEAVTAASMRSAEMVAENLLQPTSTTSRSETAAERVGDANKTAAAVKQASAAIVQMLIDRLEPLCVEVIACAQQMELMRADLSRLAHTFDT